MVEEVTFGTNLTVTGFKFWRNQALKYYLTIRKVSVVVVIKTVEKRHTSFRTLPRHIVRGEGTGLLNFHLCLPWPFQL